MADGSIKNFVDQNGDGFLNPGFLIPAGANPLDVGYADSVEELPPAANLLGRVPAEVQQQQGTWINSSLLNIQQAVNHMDVMTK